MPYEQPYVPIVKGIGFNPSPVAGNIPIWADGKLNPKVIGTTRYDEFWIEQIDRCLNGYTTGGIYIPGRYYFYLNFTIIKGLKGLQYPFYVDLDLEFFKLVDWVKLKKKTGIVSIKARRKGLSEKVQGGILNYGVRFIDGYRGGIASGKETYTQGLKTKLESSHFKYHDELMLNTITNNDKEMQYGFQVKDEVVGFKESGYLGLLWFRTMFDDPTKMEGEYFHDVVMEESGQFKFCYETYESIKPALEFGAEMGGTFYIYGTGGNILSSSKAFKDFWDQADSYGLERFWVSGTRIYYPFLGMKNEDRMLTHKITGDEIDPIKNLRKYTKEERIGMEDVESGHDYIMDLRQNYINLKQKIKLVKLNQSYPLTVDEAFTSGGSNDFNSELLYATLFELQARENPYREVVLDFVMEKGPNGMSQLTNPLRVESRPATDQDPDWKKVLILQDPKPEIRNLDIAGVDSYNMDKSATSKSLGAMVVNRRGHKFFGHDESILNAFYPVCLYYHRPPRKEQFFEISLQIAVMYNLVQNTMISAEYDLIIDWWKRHGGLRYISPRPKTFDAPKTQYNYNLGAKMTTANKPRMLALVQTFIDDWGEYIKFIDILKDGLAYDEENIGSDWDSIDALGLSLMRDHDMRVLPAARLEEANDNDGMGRVKYMTDGNALIPYIEKAGGEKEKLIRRDEWRPMSTNGNVMLDPHWPSEDDFR